MPPPPNNDRSLLAEANWLDLMIPDLNGILRGKRVPADALNAVMERGIALPRSLFASDVSGATVDDSNLGIRTGDQDRPCLAEPATLRQVPWAESIAAQCFMEMFEGDAAFAASPRSVLRHAMDRLDGMGFRAVVACELEFYLLKPRLTGLGMPQLLDDPLSGRPLRSTQVYGMDDLERQAPFLERLGRYAAVQDIPASAAVAEYAPGQFEVNLAHRDDALAAADDAVCLKRTVRRAAESLSMTASFMAKPLESLSGSGMHVHVSLVDGDGRNAFGDDETLLEAAVAGLTATMHESMLVFAPHGNSYRRFQPHAYVPLAPTWGRNNRTVAVRIPSSSADARRLEHRVAGADSNPYLVVATLLHAMAHGIERRLRPGPASTDDAAKEDHPALPLDWFDAIRAFADSDWIASTLGQPLRSLYATIKRAEYEQERARVPASDVRRLLTVI